MLPELDVSSDTVLARNGVADGGSPVLVEDYAGAPPPPESSGGKSLVPGRRTVGEVMRAITRVASGAPLTTSLAALVVGSAAPWPRRGGHGDVLLHCERRLFRLARGGPHPGRMAAAPSGACRGPLRRPSRRGLSGRDRQAARLGSALVVDRPALWGERRSVPQLFSDTPRVSCATLALDDAAVVALVNIRALSGQLGVPATRVLADRERVGDLVLVHRRLTGS